MANFIDFVVEGSKKKSLRNEFTEKVDKCTPKELSAWFKSKKFTVSEAECRKLISNKAPLKRAGKVESY